MTMLASLRSKSIQFLVLTWPGAEATLIRGLGRSGLFWGFLLRPEPGLHPSSAIIDDGFAICPHASSAIVLLFR